jgi:hypothetical protein
VGDRPRLVAEIASEGEFVELVGWWRSVRRTDENERPKRAPLRLGDTHLKPGEIPALVGRIRTNRLTRRDVLKVSLGSTVVLHVEGPLAWAASLLVPASSDEGFAMGKQRRYPHRSPALRIGKGGLVRRIVVPVADVDQAVFVRRKDAQGLFIPDPDTDSSRLVRHVSSLRARGRGESH